MSAPHHLSHVIRLADGGGIRQTISEVLVFGRDAHGEWSLLVRTEIITERAFGDNWEFVGEQTADRALLEASRSVKLEAYAQLPDLAGVMVAAANDASQKAKSARDLAQRIKQRAN